METMQLGAFSTLKVIPWSARSFTARPSAAGHEREAEDEEEARDDGQGHEEGAGAVLELGDEVRGGDEQERARGEREAEGEPRLPRAEERDTEDDPEGRVEGGREDVRRDGPAAVAGCQADGEGREAVRDLVDGDGEDDH